MKSEEKKMNCPLCNHKNPVELDKETKMLKLKCRTCGLIKFYSAETLTNK